MLWRLALAQILLLALVRADAPADARLVDISVVAVDGSGQPVTDLKPDEFRITDAGKNQQIVYFRHTDAKLQTPQPLAPGEYSNGGRANAPHVTLMLFDFLNQQFNTRALVANQIVQQLAKVEDSEGLFLYILGLDGKVIPVHGLDAETAASQESAGPWTHQIKTLMDNAMKAAQGVRPVATEDINVRIGMTFEALEAVAAQLAGFRGRKNVVWITDGIPLDLGGRSSGTGEHVDFIPQLRLLSERFDRSEVAIYPVRQVNLGSAGSDGEADSTGMGSVEFLNELAGLTGGRQDAGKDIGKSLEQARRDVSSSYQLGYFPPENNWDGKFHNLRITCTRKGVKLQARTGYYAWQEDQGARAGRAISAMVASQTDAAEIGLRGSLTADAGNPHQVRVELRIEGNDVVLAQDGDKFAGQLRIAFVLYHKDGRAAGLPVIPAELKYDAAQKDKALREGIGFREDLTLDDGAARIRAIVFDQGSGAVGSLTIPVAAR